MPRNRYSAVKTYKSMINQHIISVLSALNQRTNSAQSSPKP